MGRPVHAAAVEILGDRAVIRPGIGGKERELEVCSSGGPAVAVCRRAAVPRQERCDVVSELEMMGREAAGSARA